MIIAWRILPLANTWEMYVQAFNGLRAAPSVRQVNKLSGVGCVRRSSALQSIKAIMNPMDDPILKEAMKVRLEILTCAHFEQLCNEFLLSDYSQAFLFNSPSCFF